MKIPLFISPDDHSEAADLRRLSLHQFMASLNPQGFRYPSTSKAKVRKKTRAERISDRILGDKK